MLGGKAASQYEDTVVMEGNLLELSKRASDYFLNRLPMVSEFHHEEWDRKDYSEYPQDVLDEAVTNALIHRDMSDTTGEVLVFIYADRIEIINPGTMPENLIKKKNVVLPHVSTPRNPLMAEIFYVAGKMEKTGRGLKLIHDQMNDLKRKLPEWECLDGRTKLTIYRTPNDVRLNARVTEYIATKKVGGSFSKQDYLQYWNYKISDPTAKNDLQQMVNAGLCRKDGSGPATRYVVLANN
jgi:ATP-dependent DNA helicase RecG